MPLPTTTATCGMLKVVYALLVHYSPWPLDACGYGLEGFGRGSVGEIGFHLCNPRQVPWSHPPARAFERGECWNDRSNAGGMLVTANHSSPEINQPFFFFFFSAHFYFPASGQAVVTGVIPSPPRFCLQLLSRIGFSNPTARRLFIECC